MLIDILLTLSGLPIGMGVATFLSYALWHDHRKEYEEELRKNNKM